MQIIPISVNQDVTKGDDIGRLVMQAVKANRVSMKNHDVVVVTQKIISKSEGRCTGSIYGKTVESSIGIGSKNKEGSSIRRINSLRVQEISEVF